METVQKVSRTAICWWGDVHLTVSSDHFCRRPPLRLRTVAQQARQRFVLPQTDQDGDY